jgi:DUF4097 and DUF4098 domain-containing protein YvlB
MTMRCHLHTLAAGLVLAAAASATAAAQDRDGRRVIVPDAGERAGTRAYQGRNNGREETERFSRTIKIARDGRLTVENISGSVVVTGGSGDQVSIEAVKRTRGDRSQLQNVAIEVEEIGGRVDIRTTHRGRNTRAWVDYTITVPASISVEVESISGDVQVSNVQGIVRGESVSGNVTMGGTPNLQTAKTVSGDVSLSGVSSNSDLMAGSTSGTLSATNLKVRRLELTSISGDMVLTNVVCEGALAKSVSGNIEYGGRIFGSGRYEFNTHSGDVRLRLVNPGGFEINASSFSGDIRSDMPLTVRGSEIDRGGSGRNQGRSNPLLRGTFGDGAATLLVRTFSGDIVLMER